jgi:hypothetical protein
MQIKSSLNIAFLGDISLNDGYIKLYKSSQDPFDKIKPTLAGHDLVVGNLESIAKGNQGENELKYPRLATHSKTLHFLNELNIGAVSLAHNHIYDQLEDGYNKTIEFLDSRGIHYLGAGKTIEEKKKPLIIDRKGIKIGFLNYVSEDTNPNLPENSTVGLNLFNKETVVKDIKNLERKTDHVILLLHWGGKVEDGYYPDYNQPKFARELIDAGADLIIGHHPHTLQPYEIYKGKYIFYSLGNFCFSDIHTENKLIEIQKGKHTESVIVSVEFQKGKYTLDCIPIANETLTITQKSFVLQKLKKRNRWYKIVHSNRFFWYLYFVKLKNIDPVVFYFFGNDHKFWSQLFKLLRKKLPFIKQKINRCKKSMH